jgi:hypothetical protein
MLLLIFTVATIGLLVWLLRTPQGFPHYNFNILKYYADTPHRKYFKTNSTITEVAGRIGRALAFFGLHPVIPFYACQLTV